MLTFTQILLGNLGSWHLCSCHMYSLGQKFTYTCKEHRTRVSPNLGFHNLSPINHGIVILIYVSAIH